VGGCAPFCETASLLNTNIGQFDAGQRIVGGIIRNDEIDGSRSIPQ
jgi:hypothetical protein